MPDLKGLVKGDNNNARPSKEDTPKRRNVKGEGNPRKSALRINISKTIENEVPLLNEFEVQVYEGAKIGIVGLNGSGKSSFLKILAGIDTEFDGEVTVLGSSSRRISEKGFVEVVEGKKAVVGYLAQEPEFDESKDVFGNILGGLPENLSDNFYKYHLLKMETLKKDAREESREALKEFGAKLESEGINTDLYRMIERAREALRCPPPNKAIHFLSGGEKRRIALCRLLISQPDILLLVFFFFVFYSLFFFDFFLTG